MDIVNRLMNLVACAAACCVTTGTAFAAVESTVMAERPKVAVVAADVTLDGAPRPDVARALADSFSAGLLKSGDYRVFQPAASTTAKVKGKGRKSDMQLGTASTAQEWPVDLDYLFQFNLVGHEGAYRFTLKKIRNSTKEVLDVHELSSSGGMEKVFAMVPDALKKLNPKPVARPAWEPRTQSPAALAAPRIAWARDSQVSGNASYWSGSTPEVAAVDLSKVPKALTYQRVGSIQMINEAWKFCIIKPTSPVKLGLRHPLHILYDEDGKIYANLRVANFDGGRVIADYGTTPGFHRIFPGDEVFGWATPMH
jgi:hypothetical protein